MTDSDPEILLSHIRDAAKDAQQFIAGSDKSEFLADKKSQQAVIYSLFIIGEAATKLMNRHPKFVSEYANIPWRSIRGMRNRIAHSYFEINLDVVWDTVNIALPELLSQIDSKDS